MNISEALEVISSKYVPGVVQYYSRLNPDPWQAAHDELEKIAGVFDEEVLEPSLVRFIERCTELIDRFKREGTPSHSLSPADAYAMGGTKRVQAHYSRKLKRCAKCDAKETLTIVPMSPGSMDVVVLCAKCTISVGRIA